jgi:tRNA modification GTPase
MLNCARRFQTQRNRYLNSAFQTMQVTTNRNEDNMEEDTIYALSSGVATTATAVAVIRISGPEAHAILGRLTPKFVPPRTAVVRNLVDPEDHSPLDQALVIRFDGPKSFTGEDVVELHTHGSRAVVQGILNVLGKFARLAERGEFTQRAFASGKLNLLEVEALADLLTADTKLQRQQALRQLDGRLSLLYDNWRRMLTKGLAHAEAIIDFGDDEHLLGSDEENNFDYEREQKSVWGAVSDSMNILLSEIKSHLADDRRGELVREGVKVAIVGPPNAGKSSLFNILAQRDAAIVSPIEGTTRDVLELFLDLGGVKCTLYDTAGVREETNDVIEREGIRRARQIAEKANVLVAMIDAEDTDSGILAIKEAISQTDMLSRTLLIVNKMDLVNEGTYTHDLSSLQPQASPLGVPHNGTFFLSCGTSYGIQNFLDGLTSRVLARVVNAPSEERESALITRVRHRQHLEHVVDRLERFLTLSSQGSMAIDMAAEELRLATSEIGRITGAVDVEDVLDVLFTDFCIGK